MHDFGDHVSVYDKITVLESLEYGCRQVIFDRIRNKPTGTGIL